MDLLLIAGSLRSSAGETSHDDLQEDLISAMRIGPNSGVTNFTYLADYCTDAIWNLSMPFFVEIEDQDHFVVCN